MSITIDPTFSVYRLLQRINQEPVVLRSRPVMTRISYTIEDATRLNAARNRIFAGFQRFSKVLPQMQRYQEIAAFAESVYIFGVPDVELPALEKVTYVPLENNDFLSKEWFVISAGPTFNSALCSNELTHIDDPDSQRQFEGLWTFNKEMVDILQGWLSSAVDAPELYSTRHISL
jgi:DICT domain-containing protein